MARFSESCCPSSMKKTRVLLIEDDVREASSLEKLLTTEGYEVVVAHRGDDGLRRARTEHYDVVVTDLKMPGVTGLQIIRDLPAARPRLPIEFMTAYGSSEDTIEAARHGAFEFLRKPVKMDEFLAIIARATASARRMSEPVVLGDTSEDKDAIIGTSRVMDNVFTEIGRVAATTVPVLIRVETGTGK